MLRRRSTLLAALLAATLAAPAQAQTETGLRGISVDGTASSEVKNDAASVGVRVTARRKSAAAALAASSRGMRRVVAALKALDVDDIRTGDVRVRRILGRRDGSERRVVVGFSATNEILATVEDVKKVAPSVDAAVDAGATAISGPSFFRTDADAIYRTLLDDAFEDARAKAETLAAAAGLTLGSARYIEETGDEFGFDEQFDSFGGGGFERDREALAIPVRAGTSTIQAAVSVLFETS